jgi:hypothetical protein
VRVIVYTTILGQSDSLKPSPTGADRCVCITDQPYQDANGWELHVQPASGDPRRTAWHLRCVPHKLFPDYDRVVWIDASFTLTNLPKLLKDAGTSEIAALRHHARFSCYQEAFEIAKIGQATKDDVTRQMTAYRKAGFVPNHLSISCIIVRSHSAKVQAFNETWAYEIAQHPGDNTQLSLDYSAWINGLEIAALKGVRKDNPYAVHDHADHKKRRKPYDTEVSA